MAFHKELIKEHGGCTGYELIAEEVDAALTIEDLAAGEISEDKLAEWVEANSK